VALKLENEFVVAAPIGPTWQTLLDLERVAGCLPGATIEPVDAEGAYKGSMRVKLGPVSMNYAGTARVESLDEESHTAVFAVQGKETRGQGSATATISNRLVEEGDSTRVLVETELSVTGRPAQFGRGIMQDVAASMLDDFSRKLSVLMAADGAPAAAAPPAAAPAVESQGHEEPEALRVGGLLGRVVAGRVRALLARLLGRG
jgi:carbon monoxide dehydrogenase subunit G